MVRGYYGWQRANDSEKRAFQRATAKEAAETMSAEMAPMLPETNEPPTVTP